MKKKVLVAISLLAVAGILCYGVVKLNKMKMPIYSEAQGTVFHTDFHIKYDSGNDYSYAIDSVLKLFSNSLNPFQKGSLINRFNNNETDSTDFMIRNVWTTAYRISSLTNGMYDVTCSPFINAWGFGFQKGDAKDINQHIIDSLKQFVGYQKVHLQDNHLVKQDNRMMIDFSSISKGYSCDLVGQMLEGKKCNNYLVEIGGEVAYMGVNPSGKPWHIGIDKPIDDSTGLHQTLQIIIGVKGKGGLATSGNYRNYHIVDGKKYAHELNPLTGYPIQTDVLSATIIAPTCMLADGLATACMVLGSKKSYELMRYYPECQYYFILGSDKGKYKTIMSPGFEKLIVKK